MAQDERKGQPPVTQGKSPAPTPPDTPKGKEMNAPPPPEAPEAPATPPEAPSTAMAGDGTTDADAGELQEAPVKESESQRLRREIDVARRALEAKEAELARVEAQRQADDAAAKMVSDYSAEVPALKASERDLRQYQAAETSFLKEVLPAAVRTAIEQVDKVPRKEIKDLGQKIEREEGEAADARRDLAEARAAAAAAKERSEALKRPAASIRDRLKGADAVRADAKKASDAGNYALAYWLVMEHGKLDKAIEADPQIIEPEALSAAIKTAAAELSDAEKAVEALESRVKALDDSIQADRADLAARQRTVDATILTNVAKLNPPSAEAA